MCLKIDAIGDFCDKCNRMMTTFEHNNEAEKYGYKEQANQDYKFCKECWKELLLYIATQGD